MTKPLLIIYHTTCLDGFTAAWAVRLNHPDAELHAANYNDSPPDVKGRDVVIVDFSYKREVLLKMKEEASSLVVLDHHKTAQEDLKDLDFCIFDMNRSGAMIAWENFHPFEEPPAIVKAVEDRDLWRWALKGTKEICAYLECFEMTMETWDRVGKLGWRELKALGAPVVAFQERAVAKLVATSHKVVIDGYVVPAVNSSLFQSEVGTVLAREWPFAAVYYVRADESLVVSLRAHKDNPGAIDVSEVAKKFGGGGHKTAAGFTTKELAGKRSFVFFHQV